jgi:hypothetical protein
METSPFKYGRTVSHDSFTDREAESARLKSNFEQGINTILMSPRRWGKTSLVEKVTSELSKKHRNIKVIHLDLFSTSGEAEFLELYAREIIKASTTRWQDWLTTAAELFRTIVPKISVGIDPSNDFSLSFDRKELKKHCDEILNLAEKIAKKKKIRFVICLDEFQQLASWPDYSALEKKMRAAWQRHRNCTYCLYGSRRQMMEELFNNSGKPFYRFGDILYLNKISQKHWINYIVKGFSRSGKTITTENAALIAQLMKNHPWYVQQLAHYTWTVSRKKVDKKEIGFALEELINTNTPFYQKEIESLSNTQINLLKAILKGEQQLTSATVMQNYHLGTPNNVTKNRNILINNDLIYKGTEGYELLDPAFEIWLRHLYFNTNYQPSFK